MLFFLQYIWQYTSPNNNYEFGYPHSNPLVTFSFKNTVNHLQHNEKQRNVMMSSFQPYTAGYTVANL